MKQNTIFIIEDEFTRKVELGKLFKKEGFKVSTGSGEGVLQKIAKAKPEAIITDVDTTKPGKETAFLEKLQETEELKNSEIFVYTDHFDVSLEVKLRRLKLTYYFIKNPESQEFIIKQVKFFFSGEREEEDVDMKLFKESSKYEKEEFNRFLDPNNSLKEKTGTEIPGPLKAEDFETDYKLGEMLLDAGEYEEALEKFEIAGQSRDLKVKSSLMAGICYRNLKKYNEAISAFQEGVKQADDPEKKTDFYYELGVTLQEAGKHREAYHFLSIVYKTNKLHRGTAKRIKEIQGMLKAQNNKT